MNYALSALVLLMSNGALAHDFQSEARELLRCSDDEDFVAYEQECFDMVMAKVGDRVSPPEGQTLRTVTGSIFVRDESRPQLGEAWRDPSGLIWGEPLKAADFLHLIGGEVATHNSGPKGYLLVQHEIAAKGCEEIGARLPTLEEFEGLRDTLGWEHGYIPFGFTHLVTPMKTRFSTPPIVGMTYWTSTDDPADHGTIWEKTSYYHYEGHTGKIDTISATGSLNWARCVAQAR